MVMTEYLHGPDIDNFVLVYTMGKVGSTALAQSLHATNIFARHLQWLRPETQVFLDSQLVCRPTDFDLFHNRQNVLRCRYALKDQDYASLIKVITGIRAPIELILSHYFHSIDFFKFDLKRQSLQFNAATVRANILRGVEFYMRNHKLELSDLVRLMAEDNSANIRFHWFVLNYLNWIDFELRPFFPAEINQGFGNKGYLLVNNVLILKFEELTNKGEAAIGAFVQRPLFKLARTNVGEDKQHGDVYREVLNTIKLPREFVEHLCDAKYVRLFYTTDERAEMKVKWTE